MIDRELSGSEGDSHGFVHLHPSWIQLRTADDQLIYLHRMSPQVLSANFYPRPVGGTCGGLLCDVMGLVKPFCGWSLCRSTTLWRDVATMI
jgi:hypothetical protein